MLYTMPQKSKAALISCHTVIKFDIKQKAAHHKEKFNTDIPAAVTPQSGRKKILIIKMIDHYDISKNDPPDNDLIVFLNHHQSLL